MLKFLSLTRWENYCLLAMTSVACLVIVTIRSEARVAPAPTPVAFHVKPGPAPKPVAHVKLVNAEPRSKERAWVQRHNKIVAEAAQGKYDVMLLGDSITQGWDYNQAVWQSKFPGLRALNAGIASDRVEHILWRVQHGLFDKARPKTVVLLGGVNNLAMSNPDAIADGLRQIIEEIQKRSPNTKVLLLGIFPTGKESTNQRRAKVRLANLKVSALADAGRVEYFEFGDKFLGDDGWISKKIMFDYLHLTREGYGIWADAMGTKLYQ